MFYTNYEEPKQKRKNEEEERGKTSMIFLTRFLCVTLYNATRSLNFPHMEFLFIEAHLEKPKKALLHILLIAPLSLEQPKSYKKFIS